ncbi:MAG: hypothetical protein QJR03_03630 [Sphaerobacter sp.]|nr:hypothetical protein [Sphaerobacter sp.]
MRAWARLRNRLADLWWRLTGRPSPWTWWERRRAVRAAEEILGAADARAAGPFAGGTGDEW